MTFIKIVSLFAIGLMIGCSHQPKRMTASEIVGDDLTCSSVDNNAFLKVQAYQAEKSLSLVRNYLEDEYFLKKEGVKYLENYESSKPGYGTVYVSPSLSYLKIDSDKITQKNEAQDIEDAKKFLSSSPSKYLILVRSDDSRNYSGNWATQEIFTQNLKLITIWKDDSKGFRVNDFKTLKFNCNISHFSGEGGG